MGNILIWISWIWQVRVARKNVLHNYDASLKLKVVGYAEIHGNRAASRVLTVPETNAIMFILVVCFIRVCRQ